MGIEDLLLQPDIRRVDLARNHHDYAEEHRVTSLNDGRSNEGGEAGVWVLQQAASCHCDKSVVSSWFAIGDTVSFSHTLELG